jgi:hypothetical protein
VLVRYLRFDKEEKTAENEQKKNNWTKMTHWFKDWLILVDFRDDYIEKKSYYDWQDQKFRLTLILTKFSEVFFIFKHLFLITFGHY